MPVYVDNMHLTPKGSYGRMKMCHMVADTLKELHLMADLIGVDRKWFQGEPVTKRPHYDICQSKRVIAVRNGAIEITPKQAITIIKGMRSE